MELNTKFDAACEDTRANCPVDEVQGSTSGEEGGMNMNIILIVIGVLIVAALLGLMFMRGGGEPEETKWNEANLPVHDAVANSMYGGAQDIFQQPVAPVAAVPQSCSRCTTVAPPPARRCPCRATVAPHRPASRLDHGAVDLLRSAIFGPDESPVMQDL